MKQYIKPNTDIVLVELQLLSANSLTQVSGLDGVEKADEDFGGSTVDSRRGGSFWDED